MTRFASYLSVIGAALVLALAPGKTAAQIQTQSEDAPVEQVRPIAETHWVGWMAWSNREASDADDMTLYFRSDGVLVYSIEGAIHDNGAWRQRNRLVTFETDESSSVQVGSIRGEVMEGVAYNQDGQRGTWTIRRDTVQAYACPGTMVALRGTTAPLECICPQQVSIATVWGEAMSYTDDSDICTAAVHAGIITAAAGGRITVTPREGQGSYQGTTANGVTTLSYGSWSDSYTITETRPAKTR